MTSKDQLNRISSDDSFDENEKYFNYSGSNLHIKSENSESQYLFIKKKKFKPPEIYFDGSPHYHLSYDDWMVDRRALWMYNVCTDIYYNIESGEYYNFDHVKNAFTLDASSRSIANLNDELNSSSYYTINNMNTFGSRLSEQVKFDSIELYPSGTLNSKSHESQGENDFFFIDFDKDVIIDTSCAMVAELKYMLFHSTFQSNIKKKTEREDRHVTKLTLPLSNLTSCQGCCIYSSIFDGHGGSTCADYCVNHLGKNITSLFSRIYNIISEDPNNEYMKTISTSEYSSEIVTSIDIKVLCYSLFQSFIITNRNYIRIAEKEGLKDGCTAIVVLLYGPDDDGSMKLITSHVGDCRAVLCRHGEAIRLTDDHKPDRLDEKTRIQEQGGQVLHIKGVWRVITTVDRLSTARSIGDIHMKYPKNLVTTIPELNLLTLDFSLDDFLVMGSDGIWDVLSDQEACDIVKTFQPEKSSRKAAEALVNAARKRGSTDDKTATVIFFAW